MKLVCMSDTHGMHWDIGKVPDGDVLIHAGDFTKRGSKDDVRDFNAWLGTLPHEYKLVIAGNHDFWLYRNQAKAQKALSNCVYLQDSFVNIEGLLFYGSPWTPRFGNWAFMRERGEDLVEKWAQIPSDIDVLITHGPPFGVLDKTARGDYAGCRDLLDRTAYVENKLHVFGHIHEGYGYDNEDCVNCSICTVTYQPVNRPIVLEV